MARHFPLLGRFALPHDLRPIISCHVMSCHTKSYGGGGFKITIRYTYAIRFLTRAPEIIPRTACRCKDLILFVCVFRCLRAFPPPTETTSRKTCRRQFFPSKLPARPPRPTAPHTRSFHKAFILRLYPGSAVPVPRYRHVSFLSSGFDCLFRSFFFFFFPLPLLFYFMKVMRALGASERVMAIISSAEAPTATATGDTTSSGSIGTAASNLEIAGGAALGSTVAGRVIFKVGKPPPA